MALLATQLKEAMTPEFKQYAKQVKANAAALCAFLVEKGYKLATNGTENHVRAPRTPRANTHRRRRSCAPRRRSDRDA